MSDIEVKRLRNEVQELRDELAIMKRMYEDILYNLDTDNFSQRVVKQGEDMYTKIEQTAEEISLQAEKITDNEEKMAELSVKADEISAKVAEVTEDNDELRSSVSQTSSEIRSVVSKNISTKFESDTKPTSSNTTSAEKGMLCEYNGKLYYYNDVTDTWKVYPYADGIMSQFLQTSSGFKLTGDVSISGDLIAGGTISGSDIQGGAFLNRAGTVIMTLGGSISSDMGDMTLSTDDGRQVFQVYDDATITDFKVADSGFLASSGDYTYAYGRWDFSNCSNINWGNNAGSGSGSSGDRTAYFG